MEPTKVQEIIATIIKLPVSHNWEILDSKPDVGLYLIHYTNNANMNLYGHIRGIVVDVINGLIVCEAYKYTPVCKENLLNYSEDGTLTLIDDLGNKHQGTRNKIKIVPGFEVVTIRVFVHKGIVYYSTYRKIDVWTSGSHWGNSKTFDQMALDLKIPSADILFPNKDKLYSNYVHIFMIVHPGILNVSKINLDKGFILYGGIKQVWSLENSKFDEVVVDSVPVELEITSD